LEDAVSSVYRYWFAVGNWKR